MKYKTPKGAFQGLVVVDQDGKSWHWDSGINSWRPGYGIYSTTSTMSWVECDKQGRVSPAPNRRRKSGRCAHRSTKVRVMPFLWCAAPKDCDPASHGGTTTVETCRNCGRVQYRNQNGPHLESGEWAYASIDIGTRVECTWGELAEFYGVLHEVPDDGRTFPLRLERLEDRDRWTVGGVHQYIGLEDDRWAFRNDRQATDFILEYGYGGAS